MVYAAESDRRDIIFDLLPEAEASLFSGGNGIFLETELLYLAGHVYFHGRAGKGTQAAAVA